MAADRRQHLRTSPPARRRIPLELDGKRGVVLDFSEGGLGFESSDRLRVGEATAFEFQLPDTHHTVQGTGRLAWIDGSGRGGMRFVAVSPEAETLLSAWLTRMEAATAEAAAPEDSDVAEIQRQIALGRLGPDQVLNLVADRACALTDAEGAAIALAGTDGIICRATTGNAPGMGARLRPDSGLSGECIRTGKLIRCDDTEADVRVDREASRLLKLRSVVVAPLAMNEYAVLGLLEVFSSKVRAFSDDDVALLRKLCHLTTRFLTENGPPAVSPTVPAGELPALLQRPPQLRTPDEAGEQPTVIRAAARNGVCDVCGYRNLPSDRDCKNCDVPLPGAHEVDIRESLRPGLDLRWENEQEARTSRGVQLKRAIRPALLLLLAVLLIIALVIRWRRQNPRLQTAVSSTVQAAPAAIAPQPAPGTQTAATAPPGSQEPAAGKLESKADGAKKRTPLGVIRVTSREVRALTQPFEAPEVAVPLVDSPVLAILTAPTAQPALQTPQQITPAVLIQKVDPEYPSAAIASHVEGLVVLRALVTHKGTVESVQVESGNTLLARAAVRAVRQWHYQPSAINGQSVDTEARITINFAIRK